MKPASRVGYVGSISRILPEPGPRYTTPPKPRGGSRGGPCKILSMPMSTWREIVISPDSNCRRSAKSAAAVVTLANRQISAILPTYTLPTYLVQPPCPDMSQAGPVTLTIPPHILSVQRSEYGFSPGVGSPHRRPQDKRLYVASRRDRVNCGARETMRVSRWDSCLDEEGERATSLARSPAGRPSQRRAKPLSRRPARVASCRGISILRSNAMFMEIFTCGGRHGGRAQLSCVCAYHEWEMNREKIALFDQSLFLIFSLPSLTVDPLSPLSLWFSVVV